jgi:hypothetical protein
MDKSNYPANWKDISARIRERADGACEWCGIPNGARIHRLKSDPVQWITAADYHALPFEQQDQYRSVARIVLTVAHLDNPDPMDCRDENLAALCQLCHNRLDNPMRVRHARETRIRKKQAAYRDSGQLGLFEGKE